ncbi:MAG: FAD:protein FMN transferase [Deltaproteobacteria bacterium]|nr:FAD:protein FMN transferase [Deltaproteobacteria bacterium]
MDEAPRNAVAFQGTSMATTYHVTAIHPPMNESEYRACADRLQQALDRVDALMSTYKPDSDVSRISAAPANTPVPVASETIEVLKVALMVAEKSGGAFDPTIAPLVDLWGFGPRAVGDAAPTQAEIDAAAALVDYRRIVIDEAKRTVSKTLDGVRVDLSSTAGGYAADVAARAIESCGAIEYMAEVGGEVVARGLNKAGEPWRIGIDRPEYGTQPGEELQIVVSISGEALTTSGDYRNYREVDGRRVSHTIDPRTKQPIQHHLASVTIIAPNAALADSLDTAVAVLGPEKGMEFVRALPGIDAYLILRGDEGSFRESMTEGFSRRIAQPVPAP